MHAVQKWSASVLALFACCLAACSCTQHFSSGLFWVLNSHGRCATAASHCVILAFLLPGGLQGAQVAGAAAGCAAEGAGAAHLRCAALEGRVRGQTGKQQSVAAHSACLELSMHPLYKCGQEGILAAACLPIRVQWQLCPGCGYHCNVSCAPVSDTWRPQPLPASCAGTH